MEAAQAERLARRKASVARNAMQQYQAGETKLRIVSSKGLRAPVERPSGWKHAENRVAPKRHRESVLWQEEYADYLNSADWKRRSGEYRAKRKKCAICKAKKRTKGFDVHHVHYRTLGYETYEDLRLVCRRCHIAIHTWQHAANVSIEQATHDVWMQAATWGNKVLTPERIREYAKRKLAGTSAGN